MKTKKKNMWYVIIFDLIEGSNDVVFKSKDAVFESKAINFQ